jgi:hypothetical protein
MPALDKGTFDLWRETDDAFKSEIRQHIQLQHTINLDVERRLSTVQTTQDGYDKTVTKRTTWLSSVVAAIIGAIAGACGSAFGR